MENKAKLFICHHPAGILLFKNLAQIVKKYQKESKVLLFKVNHPYFLKFNFEPYKKYFDEIVEFEFVHYQENFLKSWWQIFKFIKKLKKIEKNLLSSFDNISLVLENSGWLPVNILLYHLSKNNKIRNITRLLFHQKDSSLIKKDKIKTFLYNFYSLPFGCYRIKVMNSLEGDFADFMYQDNIPGEIIKVTGFTESNTKEKDCLPYPVISNNRSAIKKDMIVIFGDTNIYRNNPQYFPEYDVYLKKLRTFFKSLENKYPDCKLYYKPHPAEGNQFMPGINPKKYIFFDNKVNAQSILDAYHQRIRAVYSSSSTSLVFSCFFGLPSYTFYRYLVRPGMERLDSYFSRKRDKTKSKFLFHISDLKEIGKIDNLKRPKPLNLNNIDDRYRKLLDI